MIKKIVLLLLVLFALSACQSKSDDSLKSRTTVQAVKGEMIVIKGERKISGIYPHLSTYAHGRINGLYGFGSECGIGAMAEWNNKLYMINYATHYPKGSEHKLYIIDQDMNMEIFEGSIGGTPAARMVHQESNQLLIGPYVIDSVGQIRIIPYSKMEGRLSAYARHLKDPNNMVYMYDMDGMLYEVNVNTLEVNRLFEDPLPGWHGKGAYTSQGKLVLANNGEHTSEGRVTQDKDDWENEHYQWEESWKVNKEGVFGPEKLGILAEFDGDNFKVVERSQFTDITTKNGIYAIPNDDSPLWAIGWDAKSLRLKVMDKGKWHTYLLPKATYNNDPPHGWFTEWPRIRSIGNGKMMMDMHGMFYDFPESFSKSNTAGIKPIGSHLRYIPDFMNWNGQIVLATDETSIQGNPQAGQPQSNLWFGSYEQLSEWGPASGYGAVWLKEMVTANQPSEPYLIADFDNRMVHLKNHGNTAATVTLEVDKIGNNEWEAYQTLTLLGGEYQYHILDTTLKAEWIRLKTDRASELTAAFHFTDKNLNDGSKRISLFSTLADIDYLGEVSHSKLYSNKINFNLSVYTGTFANGKFEKKKQLEFTKFNFEYTNGITDSTAKNALKMKDVWSEDDASVILNTSKGRLRLPKGHENYGINFPSGTTRSVREVESERELANISGTFYELPLFKVGQEPLYNMLRPVATHNKQITDFNTWNGLLVMSGVKLGATDSEHVYASKDGKVSLWFGGIDDLWSFGKPVGIGGPWKDTEVKAKELSDKYLMTGYDKKSVKLRADKDVKIILLLYVNHYLEEPMEYKTFDLKAGEEREFKFPEGFSAHWVQLKANADCTATAQFIYE
ncbi:MAG: hypothetical protein ACI8YQ_002664 [Polaribacter sp.]|jgi:hypothetical protein